MAAAAVAQRRGEGSELGQKDSAKEKDGEAAWHWCWTKALHEHSSQALTVESTSTAKLSESPPHAHADEWTLLK